MRKQVKTVFGSDHSVKYKIKYLWDYYWKGILVILGLVIVLCFFVFQVSSKKDSQLTVGIYTNHASLQGSVSLKNKLESWIPVNVQSQEVVVTWNDLTRQNTSAKLFATVNDHSVDILITQKSFFKQVQKDIGCQRLNDAEYLEAKKTNGIYYDKSNKVIGIQASRLKRLKDAGLTNEIVFIPKKCANKQNAIQVINKLINESVN